VHDEQQSIKRDLFGSSMPGHVDSISYGLLD
jgi:hypothetical protein